MVSYRLFLNTFKLFSLKGEKCTLYKLIMITNTLATFIAMGCNYTSGINKKLVLNTVNANLLGMERFLNQF